MVTARGRRADLYKAGSTTGGRDSHVKVHIIAGEVAAKTILSFLLWTC